MKYFLLVSVLLFFMACTKDKSPVNTPPKLITGFNLKWRNLPPVANPQMMQQIRLLKPQVLRYPGGSITHDWNWQTGLPTIPLANDVVHPIADVKYVQQQTGVDIMFVLDVVHRTVEDQILMMQSAAVPVKYIELGNELYADDMEATFPTGKEYADTVNAWYPKLKAAFPNAKMSAVMIAKSVSGNLKPRQDQWNNLVHANITVPVQAYTYHIYIADGETLAERITRFESVFLKNTGKELWVSEYSSMDGDLNKILALADYVDGIADISMSHTLYTIAGNFSKLTPDGNTLTTEGQAFVARVNR